MKEFRNKLYSYYSGYELELIRAADSTFKLISREGIRPDDTFHPSESIAGVYVKRINLEGLDNAFVTTTFAEFQGYKWTADRIDAGKILLRIDQDISVPGLKMIDRGNYELWVDKEKIERLWEERERSSLNIPYPEEVKRVHEIPVPEL